MYHLGMQTYVVKVYLRKNTWHDKLPISDSGNGGEHDGEKEFMELQLIGNVLSLELYNANRLFTVL